MKLGSTWSWEEFESLCREGNLPSLLAHLAQETDPGDRECLYVGTVHMTHRDHPQVAIAVGTQYIEEYYRAPDPFGTGNPPHGAVLKRLALLFDPFFYEDDEDYTGSLEHAIWVCEFALALGVTDDGTKGGFRGRLLMLQAGRPSPLIP